MDKLIIVQVSIILIVAIPLAGFIIGQSIQLLKEPLKTEKGDFE